MLRAKYDQKRFAIVFVMEHQYRLVKGVARYSRDSALGPILAIQIEQSDENASCGPVVYLREDEWEAGILSGDPFDCDYSIWLPPMAARVPQVAGQ